MADVKIERRRHARIKTRLPVEFRSLREVAKNAKGTLTKDISEGGVRFTSDEFLSLANRLVTTINIPTTSRQVKAILKIAWIRKLPYEDKYEIGNQFLEMSKEDKEEVAKYVKAVINLNITP